MVLQSPRAYYEILSNIEVRVMKDRGGSLLPVCDDCKVGVFIQQRWHVVCVGFPDQKLLKILPNNYKVNGGLFFAVKRTSWARPKTF